MVKLSILNLENFLDVINSCAGAVNMICPDGRRVNITRQYSVQGKLQKKYRENKNWLKIALEIPNPKDFMSVVTYYAGDC